MGHGQTGLDRINVLIRTDSSVEIGSGHLMRCLTLADQLRERGATVAFVCRDLPGALFDVVRLSGYTLCVLPERESGNTRKQLDATETIQALGTAFPAGCDLLVVDQYQLDIEWESLLRPHVRKIMVIDDLANRRHDCDLLLDQNLGAETKGYDQLVGSGCGLLLGPKFALLRPEFTEERRQPRTREGRLRQLLIAFGGGDCSGLTVMAMEAIEGLDGIVPIVDVVVGRNNPFLREIERFVARISTMRLHIQTSCMAELMHGADLMVGGAGSVTWERMAMGLPAIQIAVADNQMLIGKAAAEAGTGVFLGGVTSATRADLVRAIKSLAIAPAMLLRMSELAAKIVDGRGTKRVAAEMEGVLK